MKANENLMVGDWVKFKGSDLYHQVKVVSNKSIKFDNQKWFAKSSVEPIPLTPEILEKNGFERQNEVLHILKCSNEHYPNLIFVEYVMSNKCLFINDVMLPRPILYVHELQHALKLVDIDKEIKL